MPPIEWPTTCAFGMLEVVEKPDNVFHHFNPVGLLCLGLARTAMAADIQGNDLIVFGQHLDRARGTPIDLRTRVKAVN